MLTVRLAKGPSETQPIGYVSMGSSKASKSTKLEKNRSADLHQYGRARSPALASRWEIR